MSDIVVLALIVFIIGGAIGYIVWQKKKGVKCVGCSSSASCDKAHTKHMS